MLLDAREERPGLSFACRCRYGSRVAAALDELDWSTLMIGQGADIERVEGAFETETLALVDHRTNSTVVFAEDAATLRERVVTLAEAVESR
jgi:hypothetical protein